MFNTREEVFEAIKAALQKAGVVQEIELMPMDELTLDIYGDGSEDHEFFVEVKVGEVRWEFYVDEDLKEFELEFFNWFEADPVEGMTFSDFVITFFCIAISQYIADVVESAKKLITFTREYRGFMLDEVDENFVQQSVLHTVFGDAGQMQLTSFDEK